MKKYQNIQLTDIALKSQFVNYWLNGQYAQALDIIANNPQLDTKAFQASCFNLVAQAITTLEGYYFTNVTDYLVQELTNYNVAIGEFRNKSVWDSSTAYSVGNFVMYNSQIYLCIQANTNITPINTTYWVLIGLQGAAGAPGLGLNLRYAWSGAVAYAIDDVVIYGDYLWYATQASTNQLPSATSAYWNSLLEFPKAKIIVSATEPTGDMVYDGLIWWQIKGSD